MLAGYQLAGAPLAGSGFIANSWTKLLTESISSVDSVSGLLLKTILLSETVLLADTQNSTLFHLWVKVLTESIYSYDTYVVYNPNTGQQRDNITINPRIRGNIKTIPLRFDVRDSDKSIINQKNDNLRIDLKR